jgi:AraC-like ligand binding domain
VAVVDHGPARFDVDPTRQRADRGELFVPEPEAVHTGMAAVPDGWAHKVLYLDPVLLHGWDERDAALRSSPLGGVRDRTCGRGLHPQAWCATGV